MNRLALIIYCDNTSSGALEATKLDYSKWDSFLRSPLGGSWKSNQVIPMRNPTTQTIKDAVSKIKGFDYVFTIFTGHGGINESDNKQYLEVADGDIELSDLIVDTPRQTVIVDACRGYFKQMQNFSKTSAMFENDQSMINTARLFCDYVLSCEEGLTILFAASENQSAVATSEGSAYLLSLLIASEEWEKQSSQSILTLKEAHDIVLTFIGKRFITTQKPLIRPEKRKKYFPIAVKYTIL